MTAASHTIHIVDGSTYIFRAYHAIRSLSNSKGLPTNAVFGFAQMLLRLLDEEEPTHLAVVFDPKGPSFRKDVYAEYKANRPETPADLVPQFEYIWRVVDGLRIPRLVVAPFEADDVIATLTSKARQAGHEVVVVGSDKDLMQLVGDGVRMFDPMTGTVYDSAGVMEKWGVPPERIVDLLALMGDSSDNVPGVRGIGKKGAADLLGEYGDLDGIYASLSELKGRKRELLEEGRESAELSRDLVTLRFDAPVEFDLDDLAFGEPDDAALFELFSELEFRNLSERFYADAGGLERAATVVLDEARLSSVIAAIREAGAFAFDLETTSLSTLDARIVGIALATGPEDAWYVPVAHEGLDAAGQLRLDVVLNALGPLLEAPGIERYAQNHKYDVSILERIGVEVGPVAFDPMLASYLLDPSGFRHNLDAMALRWLRHKTIKYEDVAGKGKDAIPFAQVPLHKAAEYACEDAQVALQLVGKLRPEVQSAGLEDLLRDVELPLAPVLGRMERKGIAVDVERLAELSERFGRQMATLETKAHDLAGTEFNLGSPAQLAEILFEVLGLPVRRKTKTGYSTDSEVLESLLDKHDLPGVILQWRSVQKLRSTYAEALQRLVHPETGRIHTSFNQAVAATGRLSSSEPNLQNIPIRTEEGREIRKAFVAPAGSVLLAADYSQIELRVLAHLAGDEALLRAFRDGADVHARTAAEIYGLLPELVSREQRAHAKAINFGIIYGMGAVRLGRELGISRKQAAEMIERYFARYSGVKRYLDGTVEQARENGEVRTLLGRRRMLPDMDSPSPQARAFAERTAINTPVQGSAADIIKVAMLRVDRALTERGLEAAMLLQVHDELVLEVPEGELDEVRELVREAMEGAVSLQVPLRIDIHSGADWSEAHG